MNYCIPATIIFILLLCSGCGSIRTYLHDHKSLNQELQNVTLAVDEKKIAIKDTRGITSIGGGYYWGLIAEDPEMVQISYEEKGNTTRVFIKGVRPGITRIYYVNRAVFPDPKLGIDAYSYEVEYTKSNSSSFLTEVK